jgi:hypothetical protein
VKEGEVGGKEQKEDVEVEENKKKVDMRNHAKTTPHASNKH